MQMRVLARSVNAEVRVPGVFVLFNALLIVVG